MKRRRRKTQAMVNTFEDVLKVFLMVCVCAEVGVGVFIEVRPSQASRSETPKRPLCLFSLASSCVRLILSSAQLSFKSGKVLTRSVILPWSLALSLFSR